MCLCVTNDQYVNVEENIWRYDFSDGSSVEVQEQDTAPPSYVKVSGDFTPERVAAIEKYSFIQVVE